MIHTEAGLRSTHDALMNVQMVLWGLHQEKARHGRGYPIIAEGWVAEILKLRKEIDDTIGFTDYVAEHGVPPTNEDIDAMVPQVAVPPNGAVAPAGKATRT